LQLIPFTTWSFASERFLFLPILGVGIAVAAGLAGTPMRIRTALLSNSWGNDYPRDGWEEMFDVVVISGEVGMRKPEPEIFEHTARLLDLPAGQCVFVDDMPHNVEAALRLGFVGVRHQSYAATAAQLEALFGLSLS